MIGFGLQIRFVSTPVYFEKMDEIITVDFSVLSEETTKQLSSMKDRFAAIQAEAGISYPSVAPDKFLSRVFHKVNVGDIVIQTTKKPKE